MALPEPLDPVFVNDPHPASHNEERDAINDLIGEVEQRIVKPAGAAFGDLLRWNGTSWETTETRFLEGEGRPDGQVAAPVGSRYIDMLGEQGAVEWAKRAGGDTNTGWICLAGDTGLRGIAGQLDKRTSGTIHTAHLNRTNYVVELYIDMTMPNNDASPYTLWTLPVGFRPRADRYGALGDNKEGADTRGTVVLADGRIQILTPVSGKRDRYFGVWTTQDAWPNALPGSAL
jgi:hypothetical protein